MSSILGIAALIVSLCVIAFGLTAQVRKNYQRKSCEGLSLTLISVTFVAYAVWTAYGISKPDWFLILSQGPGAILALVLLSQYLKYHKPLQ
jgi:uncharacterized protein with PQ loop repeat